MLGLIRNLCFSFGILIPFKAFAKCKYDHETGLMLDDQTITIVVTFFLVVLICAYPLRRWAEEHPGVAFCFVIAGPAFVGFIASGRC